jgi:hypothetical protein
MKKLVMTAAVLGSVASIVSAQVYSQNVVGYMKTATPTPGSVDILSVSPLAGDTVDIQDAILNLDDLNSGGSVAGDPAAALAVVDKIYVWNGSSYNAYGLYAGASNYWMNVLSAGWNKSSKAAPDSGTIDLGKGLWFQSVDGSKTIGFTQNYNLN